MKLSTIGFTKKTAQRFFDLLKSSGARRIVDVRLNNQSQLAGFAKQNDLAWLASELCGMDYIHIPDLAPTKELFKDYRQGKIQWEEYESRFRDLMTTRKIETTVSKEMVSDGCLLCSEDQPHFCHRRLVAEYLDEKWGGIQVDHLGLKESTLSQE